jgi:hypothetical protein
VYCYNNSYNMPNFDVYVKDNLYVNSNVTIGGVLVTNGLTCEGVFNANNGISTSLTNKDLHLSANGSGIVRINNNVQIMSLTDSTLTVQNDTDTITTEIGSVIIDGGIVIKKNTKTFGDVDIGTVEQLTKANLVINGGELKLIGLSQGFLKLNSSNTVVSETLTIGDVDNLSNTLSGKSNIGHTHITADITNLATTLSNYPTLIGTNIFSGTNTFSNTITVTSGNISTQSGNIYSSGTIVAGTGITATTGGITITAGDLSINSGNMYVAGDITCTGHFTVNGTTTTINSIITSINDPLIKLADGNTTADSQYIGFYGEYKSTVSGSTKYAGLHRKPSVNSTLAEWELYNELSNDPSSPIDNTPTGITSYAALKVGTITIAGTGILNLGSGGIVSNSNDLNLTTLTSGNIIMSPAGVIIADKSINANAGISTTSGDLILNAITGNIISANKSVSITGNLDVTGNISLSIGAISFVNLSTGFTSSLTTTASKITPTSQTILDNINFTATAGRLTYTGSTIRKFMVMGALSSSGFNTNDTSVFYIYVNDVEVLDSASRISGSTNRNNNISTIVSLNANDYVEIFASNNTRTITTFTYSLRAYSIN